MIRIGERMLRTSPSRGPSGAKEFSVENVRPLGWLKYGVLVKLKNSDRNCTFQFSWTTKFLNSEKSRFRWPA